MNFQARAQRLAEFVDRLFADEEALITAVVADGWSRSMAREGLRLHRQSWCVDTLRAAAEAELAAFGGVDALDAGWLSPVSSAVHIWPALPGTGLPPLLYGFLVGVPRQFVRPSRRGAAVASHLVETWRQVVGSSSLVGLQPGADWRVADLVVVSGSDATLAAVEEAAGPERAVVGYGHRVSMALIEAGAADDAVVRGLADDAVLWRGAGCFSLRGVIFVGAPASARDFGRSLGRAIAEAEARLDPQLSAGQHADRVQARGVAEFGAEIFGPGLGWVELDSGPFLGRQAAPHVVTLHPIEGIEELEGAIALSSRHLQGAALAVVDPATRDDRVRRLGAAGFTRICAPGRLQAPPADWPHDGRPNTLHYLRLTHLDAPLPRS